MKKTIIAAMVLAGLAVANTAMANEDRHTASVGYIQGKISDTGWKLKGVNLQYQYEWGSPVSVIASLSYMSGKAKFTYEGGYDKDKFKLSTFKVGPAYRFNDYVSIYGDVGLAHATLNEFETLLDKQGDSISTSTIKSSSTSLAYGLGVIINPIDNVSVNIGYERAHVKIDESYKVNSFKIGIGYRF